MPNCVFLPCHSLEFLYLRIPLLLPFSRLGLCLIVLPESFQVPRPGVSSPLDCYYDFQPGTDKIVLLIVMLLPLATLNRMYTVLIC